MRVDSTHLFNHVIYGHFGKALFAAGVDVERHIAELGPCMHRQVGFAYYHYAAHAVWRETIERNSPYLCLGASGGFNEHFLHAINFAYNLFAARSFYYEMTTPRAHFPTPPFVQK